MTSVTCLMTFFFLLSSTSCSGVLHGAQWASSGRRGLCWSPLSFCSDLSLTLFTAWWQPSPTLPLPWRLKWQQSRLVYCQRSCSSSEYLVFYSAFINPHAVSVLLFCFFLVEVPLSWTSSNMLNTVRMIKMVITVFPRWLCFWSAKYIKQSFQATFHFYVSFKTRSSEWPCHPNNHLWKHVVVWPPASPTSLVFT